MTRKLLVPGTASTRRRRMEPVLLGLLAVDLLLFTGGAATHSRIPIPLGFATWIEPRVVPAAIVEGLGAAGLTVTLISITTGAAWAVRLARWVLWYCFAGVLWGMSRLAAGSIPEARTVTNDFLHIAMTLVTTIALVRLADTDHCSQEPILHNQQGVTS